LIIYELFRDENQNFWYYTFTIKDEKLNLEQAKNIDKLTSIVTNVIAILNNQQKNMAFYENVGVDLEK
jgi:hypothetical protein